MKFALTHTNPKKFTVTQLNGSEFPQAWKYRSTFTINTSVLSGDLTNIALRVYLDRTTFDFLKFKGSGADIRFTDLSGNLLYHEVDYWIDTAGSEEAVIWVLLPVISSVNNYFYMYYGNVLAADIQNPIALWTAAGVVAVWHFAESSGTAIVDSSVNNADAVLTGVNTTPQRTKADGISAIQLNKYRIGSHLMGTERIEGGNIPALCALSGNISVSINYKITDNVVKPASGTSSILTVDKNGDGSLITENFAINLSHSDGRSYINFGDGVLTGRTDGLLLCEWGINDTPFNTWNNFVGYLAGNIIRCALDGSHDEENPPYVDGFWQELDANGGVRQTGNKFGIGFPFPITADIDDIKVFSRALSDDELLIESMNFKNSFLAVTDTEVILPDAPSGLALTLISGGVKVDFTDNTAGTAKHELWGRSDAGAYSLLALLEAGVVTYSDVIAPVDLRYYKVRARIVNACSAFIEDDIAMLGAELTTNGDFSSSAWWGLNGATIIEGVCRFTGNAINSGIYKEFLTVGKTYRVQYEIKNYASGSFNCLLTGLQSKSANGIYTANGVANNTYMLCYATAANTTLDVDDISVKEVLVP